MTNTGKILLGVGGVIVAIVIILGALVFYLIDKDRERSWKLNQEGVKRDQDAGMEFGKTTDQNGCMDEGIRMSRIAYRDRNEITVPNFVVACLENSKPVQDFCVGVPPYSYPNDPKWPNDECRKAGLDPQKTDCGHAVFEVKQRFCHPEGAK